MKKYLMIVGLALIFGSSLCAVEEDPIGTVSVFGGSFFDMKVVGNRAYTTTNSEFIIYDMTYPSLPHKIGEYYTPGNSSHLDILGNYAYILTYYDGLYIINISDPSKLVLSGVLDGVSPGAIDGTSAGSITIVGDYAYIARGSEGLSIVNISNPNAPILASTYGVGSAISDVKVVGNYAYLADSHEGLKILDVTNPASPILLGVYDTLGGFTELDISGNYVYMINWRWLGGSKGLNIIDISNPNLPTLTGTYGTGNYAEVGIVGNDVYIMDLWSNLFVIDVSDPSSPSQLSYLPDYDDVYAPRMSISGEYLYAVADNILKTINISNSNSPVLEHIFTMGTIPNSINSIKIIDNYAYTTSLDRFRILDISNATSPYTVGELNATVEDDAYMQDLDISGDYAYIAENNRNNDINYSKLRIVNVSNTSLPEEEGHLDINVKYIISVQVHNGYAYITVDEEGLRIVDIRNPSLPVLVASYNTPDGSMRGIDIFENYAYVADGHNGVHIIDISTPSQPVLVGQYISKFFANTVKVKENYAYVGTTVGVEIIDITNLSSLKHVSSIFIAGCFGIIDIKFLGNDVYAQGYTKYLTVVNVSNPALPVQKRQFRMVNAIMEVALAGNYAYSADTGGLIITKIKYTYDNDGDEIVDSIDTDDDNDGVLDVNDAFPFDPNESVDTDHDGVGNNADTDDDNDGYSDVVEHSEGTNALDAHSKPLDTDRDFIPNSTDTDDDNDGISDALERANGLNPLNASDAQADLDHDGFSNAIEIQVGTDIRKASSKPIWVPIGMGDIVTFVPALP